MIYTAGLPCTEDDGICKQTGVQLIPHCASLAFCQNILLYSKQPGLLCHWTSSTTTSPYIRGRWAAKSTTALAYFLAAAPIQWRTCCRCQSPESGICDELYRLLGARLNRACRQYAEIPAVLNTQITNTRHR